MALQTITSGAYTMTYNDTITTTLDPLVPGKFSISWSKPTVKKNGKNVPATKFAYKLIVSPDQRYKLFGIGEDVLADALDNVVDSEYPTLIERWVTSGTSFQYSEKPSNKKDFTGHAIKIELFLYASGMYGTANFNNMVSMDEIDYSVLPTISKSTVLAPCVPEISIHKLPKNTTITATTADYRGTSSPDLFTVSQQNVVDAGLSWASWIANSNGTPSGRKIGITTTLVGSSFVNDVYVKTGSSNLTVGDFEIMQLNIASPSTHYLSSIAVNIVSNYASFFNESEKAYSIQYRKNVGVGATTQWTTLDSTNAILLSSGKLHSTVLFAIPKTQNGSEFGDYEIKVSSRIKSSQISIKSGMTASEISGTGFGQETNLKFRVNRDVNSILFMSQFSTVTGFKTTNVGNNTDDAYIADAYNTYTATPSDIYVKSINVDKVADLSSSSVKTEISSGRSYQVLHIVPPTGDMFNAVKPASIPTAKAIVAGILSAATVFLSKQPDGNVFISEMPSFGIYNRSSGSKLPISTSLTNLNSTMTSGVLKTQTTRQSTLLKIITTIEQVNVLLRQELNSTTVLSVSPQAVGMQYMKDLPNKYATAYRDRIILLPQPFRIERTSDPQDPNSSITQSSLLPEVDRESAVSSAITYNIISRRIQVNGLGAADSRLPTTDLYN